jgi:hypothetical protein
VSDRLARFVLQYSEGVLTVVGSRAELAAIELAFHKAAQRGEADAPLGAHRLVVRCWDPIAPPSTRTAYSDEELPRRPRPVIPIELTSESPFRGGR